MGPRKTGKTTLLHDRYAGSLVYDLRRPRLFLNLSVDPAFLREQLERADPARLRRPIIVNEFQMVPQVLDEVRWLIENRGLQFILCGSSTRTLKGRRAKLLEKRTLRFDLFPLVWKEIRSTDLLRILNRGLLPDHYLDDQYRPSLKAYVEDYLAEILGDGVVRDESAFARFLEVVARSHGERPTVVDVARQSAISVDAVNEYYQILVETLVGRWVLPFYKPRETNVIVKGAKFYLFDVGVTGSVARRNVAAEKGKPFQQALEHFVFMELTAHSSYSALNYPIQYWATKNEREIDFILGGGEIAVDVVGTSRVEQRDLRSMATFIGIHRPRRAIVVCNEPRSRVMEARTTRSRGEVEILRWSRFLEELWSGRILR